MGNNVIVSKVNLQPAIAKAETVSNESPKHLIEYEVNLTAGGKPLGEYLSDAVAKIESVIKKAEEAGNYGGKYSEPKEEDKKAGSYDGKYAEKDDTSDDDYCECDHCKGSGKMKKAKTQEATEAKQEEAVANATANTVSANGRNYVFQDLPLAKPTKEDIQRLKAQSHSHLLKEMKRPVTEKKKTIGRLMNEAVMAELNQFTPTVVKQ